jgi:hypothetical protein
MKTARGCLELCHTSFDENLTISSKNFIVLKQIETSDLRLGMYIAKVGEKWFDSPFWRSAFLLSSEQEEVAPFVWTGISWA